MSVSRRDFLGTTLAATAAGFVRLDARAQDTGRRVFLHGVASGDPLSDRVILWTRVTALAGSTPEVAWELSTEPSLSSPMVACRTPSTQAASWRTRSSEG